MPTDKPPLTDPKTAHDLLMKARQTAQQSEHPTNKIGAVLKLRSGEIISSPNLWLHAFSPDFDEQVKIGGSSPTKHAEPATIAKAAKQGLSTLGAELFITDPLCPNCMLAMASAGLERIYIDAASFEGASDWYTRRSHHFDSTSMQIAANAGLKIIKATIKGGAVTLETLTPPKPTKTIAFDAYYTSQYMRKDKVNIDTYESALRMEFNLALKTTGDQSRASAVFIIPDEDNPDHCTIISARDIVMVKEGQKNKLLADVIGEGDSLAIEQSKYHARIFPLSNVRSICGRMGVKVTQGTQIITSYVPTSHEIVNLCDIIDRVQLRVIHEDRTWMEDDLAAMDIFTTLGADLRKPPTGRKLLHVING